MVLERHLGGYDPVGLGGGYSKRPNITDPGVKMTYPKKASLWFDTSRIDNAVVQSWLGGTNQGFGNASKDAIVGPGRVNFTTSLYKSFAVTEGMHFELRFESFNTFNHTQYNGVSQLGSGNFGQVTSAWDSRKLESAASSCSKSTPNRGAAGIPCRAPFL